MEKPDHPGHHYREPELQQDLHRPVGAPRPREIKSQKAQLNSGHRPGTDKDVKLGMNKKTGHLDD
ncbi:hypothetical protein SAMN05660649_02465 [Desulfotomaculum arcticum]|uniref:Uncharacterized protein n=1 Tax=Desulfotruncus arcticus DSM 17038 TaxID=1121424 RepID=A0A1I2U6J0_9FIRM|nr:hypothetical protein [Desulfotruncus arcticus]SFG71297.1 hypothetical protein SAMN05660649_02465 [Desulfotomaculum arcticum] [Desulfotruncus arcticus DSM 17038]